VAVVTGGGSGIGEAIAIRLHEDGARVAILDIDTGAAELTAALAGGGLVIACDVSDSGAVDAALREVERTVGPVDIWVNNAGIAGAATAERINPRAEQQMAEAAEGEITTPLDGLVRLPDEEWSRMLAVHLNGTFFGMRAAARSMVSRGAGSIINIASICGIEGCTGHPHYSAAKAGILGLTRAAAKELAVQGVRANAIAPGYVDTALVTSSVTEQMLAALRLATPIGRLGRPAEIASVVSFLASDEASFFIGATVTPSGGFVTV
jgi:3-oxoacyl-[acyl-carrier protein] reductase